MWVFQKPKWQVGKILEEMNKKLYIYIFLLSKKNYIKTSKKTKGQTESTEEETKKEEDK